MNMERMNGEKRNTVTYALKKGGKTVYIGTTNDPDRREIEHKADGKKFTKMTLTSRRMTEAGAQKKEEKAIQRYKKNQGKTPKYNKDEKG